MAAITSILEDEEGYGIGDEEAWFDHKIQNITNDIKSMDHNDQRPVALLHQGQPSREKYDSLSSIDVWAIDYRRRFVYNHIFLLKLACKID